MMQWIPFKEQQPNSTCSAYFISGHEWFGIGIWENDKGWVKGFIGEWPHGDDGDFLEDHPFLNDSVLYWANIDGKYPIR